MGSLGQSGPCPPPAPGACVACVHSVMSEWRSVQDGACIQAALSCLGILQGSDTLLGDPKVSAGPLHIQLGMNLCMTRNLNDDRGFVKGEGRMRAKRRHRGRGDNGLLALRPRHTAEYTMVLISCPASMHKE